jgi:Arc/MetJ family transcription regulator
MECDRIFEEESTVSRTVIDLGDEALKAAARELGTTTKRDTVNTALREIAARNHRARAWADLQCLTAEGVLGLQSS